MNPSQGSSTTAEPESVAVTLVCLTDQNTDEQKILPWDFQASVIVYELHLFGCSVQNIQAVLQSYGFICSPQDTICCIDRYKDIIRGIIHYLKHDKGRQPLDDPPPIQEKKIKSELLQARAPYWETYLYSMDGRQLRVELTKGQVQTRVVGVPDVNHP